MAEATFTLKLQGTKELEESFLALEAAVGKRVLLRAVKKAAEPIAEQMKTNLASRRRTGKLEGGIGVRTLRGDGTRRENSDVETVASVAIGPEKAEFYAHFSEFGTPNEPARPWARPAADAKHGEALKVFGDELGASIRRAAWRAAK